MLVQRTAACLPACLQIYEDEVEGWQVAGLTHKVAKSSAEMRASFNGGRANRDMTVSHTAAAEAARMDADALVGQPGMQAAGCSFLRDLFAWSLWRNQYGDHTAYTCWVPHTSHIYAPSTPPSHTHHIIGCAHPPSCAVRVCVAGWLQKEDVGSVHDRAAAIFTLYLAQFSPAASPGEEDRIVVSKLVRWRGGGEGGGMPRHSTHTRLHAWLWPALQACLTHPTMQNDPLAGFVRQAVDAKDGCCRVHTRTRMSMSMHAEPGVYSAAACGWLCLRLQMFVDMPGSERLADDPEILRLREGPLLNRSLHATGAVLRALHAGQGLYVNYEESNLTKLLAGEGAVVGGGGGGAGGRI